MSVLPHLNTRELEDFSKLMQAFDYVSGLYTCLEFSQLPLCFDEAKQTRKKSSIAQLLLLLH